MHPYSTQALVAERVRDLREHAAAARRAAKARSARHGHRPIADRVHARRPGTPRWA